MNKQPKQDWGFYAVVPRVVRTGYKNLTHAEKWFYTCLKDLCHDKGTCFRTLRSLEEETGISLASLSKMIPNLAEVGLIHAEKKRNGRSGKELWHISIVDIWQSNATLCSKNEQMPNEVVQKMNTVVQKMNNDENDSSVVCSDFSDRRTLEEKVIEEECSSNQPLPQPERDTPTFSENDLSDAELITLCQKRNLLPKVDDYTTSPTIESEQTSTQPSMQLSTQANDVSTVDVHNSQSENGSQSYSHKPTTSPATNVGKMGVLDVPLPPVIEGVVIPPTTTVPVKPQAPTKPSIQAPPPQREPIVLAQNRVEAQDRVKLFHAAIGFSMGLEKWDWEAAYSFAMAFPVYDGIEQDIRTVYAYCTNVRYKDDAKVIVNMEKVWTNWGYLKKTKAPTLGQSSSDGEIGVSGRRRFRAPEGFGQPRQLVGGVK